MQVLHQFGALFPFSFCGKYRFFNKFFDCRINYAMRYLNLNLHLNLDLNLDLDLNLNSNLILNFNLI